MKKIIDFPRSKRILKSDKFQPALHSVIGKMIYCENTCGYWSNNTDLMAERLDDLCLYDAFIEKLNEFKAAEIKQSFEIVSNETGEIFALVEDMDSEEAGQFYLSYYAFTDEFAFLSKQMDLFIYRLPFAKEKHNDGTLFDLEV